MEQVFTASVWREGEWHVASEGESEEDAMKNLQEALALHLEAPVLPLAIQGKRNGE